MSTIVLLIPSNMKTFYHLSIEYDMLLIKNHTRPNLTSQTWNTHDESYIIFRNLNTNSG